MIIIWRLILIIVIKVVLKPLITFVFLYLVLASFLVLPKNVQLRDIKVIKKALKSRSLTYLTCLSLNNL